MEGKGGGGERAGRGGRDGAGGGNTAGGRRAATHRSSVMRSLSCSSGVPRSRRSASIAAKRSFVTSWTIVSGTSKSSGRSSTSAFERATSVFCWRVSAISCSTPSLSFASRSAQLIPALTRSANASFTSGSWRVCTLITSTSKSAAFPASCGADERAGNVTAIDRVSPSVAPTSPSTRPCMNFPSFISICSDSPPATCGSGSPLPPSAVAK